jgi:tRNA(fMet)-specific endonuclease VapC
VIRAYRYLLDTNIISDLITNPRGKVSRRIARKGEGTVCTSIVVASELRFGAAKSGSPKLVSRVEEILEAIDVLALDEPSDRRYAQLRVQLERAGTPIGPNDMLIAAHALALGLTMVTANTDEFGQVAHLPVENWLDLKSTRRSRPPSPSSRSR